MPVGAAVAKVSNKVKAIGRLVRRKARSTLNKKNAANFVGSQLKEEVNYAGKAANARKNARATGVNMKTYDKVGGTVYGVSRFANKEFGAAKKVIKRRRR